jgi:hypothetical protein
MEKQASRMGTPRIARIEYLRMKLPSVSELRKPEFRYGSDLKSALATMNP